MAKNVNLAGRLEFRLDRRELLKRSMLVSAAPMFASLMAACGDDADTDSGTDDAGTGDDGEAGASETDDTETDEDASPDDSDGEASQEGEGEGEYGGTLNVALIGESPTLDLHQSTTTIVALLGWHLYEALFTWNENYEVTPELVESHEVSDDGMVNTVTLRQGVMFHNGEEMTANDVAVSIQRWGDVGGFGESLTSVTDEMEQIDDYTIDFHMSEPYGAFASVLARTQQGCAIHPAAMLDEVGTNPFDHQQAIGTGPYQMTEYVPDAYIHMTRFEDYVSREEEPSGYAGRKYQYVDEIFFRPAPDEANRVAGLQAGDYDYLESLSTDHFDTLSQDDGVEVEELPSSSWGVYVLNMAEGIMTDLTMRQAVQAGLDHEPALQAAYGDFYRTDPSIMMIETVWHSLAGEELYSRADPERSAELLEEAGYDGEPIRFMVTQEYQHHYNQTVVGVQQLEEIGFVIDLQVYDWATLTDLRTQPAEYDIFTTNHIFVPDPLTLPFIPTGSWPGWWENDEKAELAQQLAAETDFDARYEAFEGLQRLFYEQVPMINLGDQLPITARSARVRNFVPQTQLGPFFWNVWLAEG